MMTTLYLASYSLLPEIPIFLLSYTTNSLTSFTIADGKVGFPLVLYHDDVVGTSYSESPIDTKKPPS